MIDLHTHIVPDFDDGARNVGEVIAMARVAVADGIEQLVATPHSFHWKGGTSELRRELGLLQDALDSAGIRLRLIPGSEVMLAPRIVESYRAGAICAINDGPYMLVEMPLYEFPAYAAQSIFELQIAGIVPVLAHPERYEFLNSDLGVLYDLVARGVLVQITASSLLGAFGDKARHLAEVMLTHRLAHVVASDAHSPVLRPPVLSKARERARALIGEDDADELFDSVPRRIVEGVPIDLPEPLPQRSKWRRFSWSSS